MRTVYGFLIPVVACVVFGVLLGFAVPLLGWWQYALLAYGALIAIQMAKQVGR